MSGLPNKPNHDLVIDSWSNEDGEKANKNHFDPYQQYQHQKSEEGKKNNASFTVTGWGGPPPAHPSGWINATKPPMAGEREKK